MARGGDPVIIQGGMGVAVSQWQLASAVARTGQLGVVSGTALDVVLARRLQTGDEGGHLRRAMAEFPLPAMAERIVERYFRPGGKTAGEPFVAVPMPSEHPTQTDLELIVVANFVEVYLAKEHHDGLVGINYLEKIQLPTIPALFGALLAGVDYVLMGAGIPTAIPGILDRLCEGKPAELRLRVQGASESDGFVTRFDPDEFTGGQVPWLRRPKFLPIVGSATLAAMLKRKSTGSVEGFVVEGPAAGGHNAPPRGPMQLNERGEPVYGARDAVDLEAMRELGLPFWLAGAYGSPRQVVAALDAGAAGVQVGTAFAFCDESGMRPEIRREVIRASQRGEVEVRTDPLASPAGFPFKVLSLEGSVSDPEVYEARTRRCDLGFLRQAYRREDGSIGWRCPAEPVAAYEKKGGAAEETVGRKCVCNGLMADIALGQVRRASGEEPPLVTCGDDVRMLPQFLASSEAESYSARDVVEHLLSLVSAERRIEACL